MKYGEAVGKWKLEVGGFDKELNPLKGDSRKFLKLMTGAAEKGTDYLLDQFEGFMKELIKRDYPPLNKEEEDELDVYVEFNLMALLTESQVQFRFITREELLKQKKEVLQTPEGINQAKPMFKNRSQGYNSGR